MKHLIARHYRVLVAAIACVALGIGIGAITSAGATTTKPATSSAGAGARGTRGQRLRRRRGILRRSVHGDLVVHTQDGFQTASFDRGRVDSVSGDRLTLTEGTPKSSYRSVTLTIPADARVRDNGSRTELSSVTAGQRVLVIQAPKRTFVLAHTPKQG
jgi:hypothetical protein